MSHVYSPIGSGAYVGAYTMPDDGDPRNASAFNVPMEGIAEDVKRVKGSIDSEVTTRTAGNVDYASSRYFDFHLTFSSSWSRGYNSGTNMRYWLQTAHTSPNFVESILELPDQFILSSVQIWFDPGTGRATAPFTPPSIRLLVQNNENDTSTQVATATDPVTTPTLAAYEQLHSLTMSPISPLTVTPQTRTYGVVFSGETGANAQNGTRLFALKVSGTVRKVF
jgi:hypothetical protein